MKTSKLFVKNIPTHLLPNAYLTAFILENLAFPSKVVVTRTYVKNCQKSSKKNLHQIRGREHGSF